MKKINFNAILGVAGTVLAVAGSVVSLIAAAKSSLDDDIEDTPKKFKVFCNGYDEGTFDSEEDAQEYIGYLRGCAVVGAESLHLNNPGDYDEYDYGDNNFEIVEQ